MTLERSLPRRHAGLRPWTWSRSGRWSSLCGSPPGNPGSVDGHGGAGGGGGGDWRSRRSPRLVIGNGRRFGSAPAYHVRGPGGWEATPWAGYAAEVRRAGAAFVALGVEPGQAVGILGANRPEWVIVDVAPWPPGPCRRGSTPRRRRPSAPTSSTTPRRPSSLVENDAQWQKIAAVRGELPHLRHVVMMRGRRRIDDPMVWAGSSSWPGATGPATGRVRRAAGGPAPRRRRDLHLHVGHHRPAQGRHADPGQPEPGRRARPASSVGARQSDRLLSYLPLSHIAEQMFTIHIAAAAGFPVYYAESLDKLNANLVEVKPTLFFGVPRVWEKFHAGVRREAGREHRREGQAGRAGHRRRPRRRDPRGPGGSARRSLDAARYNALRQARVLEGEGRRSACPTPGCASAAPPRCRRRSWSSSPGFGLPVYEVYGQSEDCGPTTFNVPGRTRFGTVGPAFPGVEVKIADDGEIIVRGRNVFAGYAKDPEATAEALADGWLHTGDLGEFDADGYLVDHRPQEGHHHHRRRQERRPQAARGRPAQPPAGGSEAVVIGDRRKYLTALVTLDAETAGRSSARSGACRARPPRAPRSGPRSSGRWTR